MNDPVAPTPRPEDLPPPEVLSLDRILEAVWETAVESFIRAILMTVFGGIAIGLASGIWQKMAPSRPPGFQAHPEAESTASSPRPFWQAWIGEHRFLLLWGLIFLVTLWSRLVRRRVQSGESQPDSVVAQITHHLSENWFGLIVGNAFGALLSALVVCWLQQFTLANLLFHWAMDSILAGLHSFAERLLGPGRTGAFQAWFHWYGDNQFKFTFWFFYVSAICDDLGIPNFKTIGAALLGRLRRGFMRRGEIRT
jgi:hypothetical protein